MKKFYFFLVALVLGVMSASAIDYYLIGGFQKPDAWTLKDPACLFEAQGDGTYVLDYEGQLTSGFKINDGTWGDAANFGSNGTKLALGTPYNYGVGSSTSDISLEEGVVDNPHLVLDTNNGTLTITGQQAEVKITYDLWGNLPDQAEAWSSTTLTNVEGDVWVAKDVNVTAQSDFGIRELTNGSQSNWIWATGANEISSVGTFACGIQAEAPNGINFTIAPGKWTLSFNAATMELVVTSGTGAVEGIEVEENVAPVYYNLQGVRVAEPTNGLYIVVRGDKVAKELVK